MATWKKSADPQRIIDRLSESRTQKAATTTQSGSGVSFESFAFTDALAILEDSIEFREETSSNIRYRLCRDAAFAAGLQAKMTAKYFLSQVTRLESKYLSTAVSRYYVLTSISVSPSILELPRSRLGDTTIMFVRRLPKKWHDSRAKLADSAGWSFDGDLPDRYLYVKVGTSGRSIEDAAQSALDSIDVLRGIWNLGLNRMTAGRMSSGKRSPVNALTLGPLHSVHTKDGGLATDMWWYDPNYRGPIQPMSDRTKIGKMLKYASSFRRLLSRNPYREFVEVALQRYVHSLDQYDWEDSFVRLWSTLEWLTGAQNVTYKTIVKRASFMFDDYEYSREVLSRLAELRNEIVHAGKNNDQIETKLFLVKRFVEPLIEFHARGRFGSPQEAFDFLDHPPDPKQLRREIRALRAALRFRSTDPVT